MLVWGQLRVVLVCMLCVVVMLKCSVVLLLLHLCVYTASYMAGSAAATHVLTLLKRRKSFVFIGRACTALYKAGSVVSSVVCRLPWGQGLHTLSD